MDILNITSTIVDETTGKMLEQGIHVNSEIHAIIGDRMLNTLFTVVSHLGFVSKNLCSSLTKAPERQKVFLVHTYSRVHISSDEVFFKILKKPSIVQE